MWFAIAIGLLEFIVYSCAEEMVAESTADTLGDKSVDRRFSHVLKASPLHADLDSTLLGKPGQMAIPAGKASVLAQPFAKDAMHVIPFTRLAGRSDATFLPSRKAHSAAALTKGNTERAEAAVQATIVTLGSASEEEDLLQRHWHTRRESAARIVAALAALWAQPKHASAAAVASPPTPTKGEAEAPPKVAMREVAFKSFRLKAPAEYEEFPEAQNALPGVYLFMVNPTGGLTGNSITLLKQATSSIDFAKFGAPKDTVAKKISDIGSIEAVASKVVKADGGELQSAQVRQDKTGQQFYQIDYTKGVFGLPRRTLLSLTIANDLLYTVLVDMGGSTYDTPEGDALRQAASSLSITDNN